LLLDVLGYHAGKPLGAVDKGLIMRRPEERARDRGGQEAAVATKGELFEALRNGRGCLGGAALDEPVFILCAQDILAPRVVVRWAHLADQAGYSQDKVRDALILAKQMADWRAIRAGAENPPDTL
jgi:hypothetical protein